MAEKSTKSENDTSSTEAKIDKKLARKDKKIRNLYIVITALVVIMVGGGAYGYMQYSSLKDENKKLSNPEEAAKIESQRLKSEIAKLVDVPADEEPTIATVTDISKLKDQPFFAKAENGDKVFMYAKAKKAILYRPSTNKVVELAPINSSDKTPDKQEGVQPSNGDTTNKSSSVQGAQTTAPSATQQETGFSAQ